MARCLKIRKPNATEIRHLLQWVEEPLETPQQRRAQAILLYTDGMCATEIAETLQVHANTIYADVHAFDQHGLDSVKQVGRRGAIGRITEAQKKTIYRLADQAPYELGLPYGRWSLAKFRAYLIQQRILSRISREHLRRLLKKGGSVSAGFSAN